MDKPESPNYEQDELPPKGTPNKQYSMSKTDPLPKLSIEEMKAKGEEERKNAETEHSRKRDTWVTLAGLFLLLFFVMLYWATASFMEPSDNLLTFLHVLSSVIMLIIGYIFTRTGHR